jgi:hypothetical protein
MGWSWIKAAVGGGGQSRKEPRLAIALEGDFDQNVGRISPIDKGPTPSYLSANPAHPAATRRPYHEGRHHKCGIFRISAAIHERAPGSSRQKSVSAVAFPAIGFGRVRQRHLTGPQGLTA